jgi:calcium-dependent protein kinase
MDEKERKWFANEIFVLKSLDHPNIVKLYEIYEDETRFFLV